MSRRLVGIRHKTEVYIAKGHPRYDTIDEVPGSFTLVDSLESPDGSTIWMQAIAELEGVVIEIRFRVEECDQFVYLVEEDNG